MLLRLWRDPVVLGLALAAALSWWLFAFDGLVALPAWWSAARDAWPRPAASPMSAAPAGGPVAAVVNGEPISLAELEQRTELHLAYFRLGGGTESSYADIRPQIALDVLREMVDERLVRQEMRGRRVAPTVTDPEVEARLRAEVERRLGTEARLQEELQRAERAGLSLDYARQVLREKIASERFAEQIILRGVPPDEQALKYYGFLGDLRGRARVEVHYATLAP